MISSVQTTGAQELKKLLNAFLRSFSPLIAEKYGNYTYEIVGDHYHGYNVVATDPLTRGQRYETTDFHRVPIAALRKWAKSLSLI